MYLLESSHPLANEPVIESSSKTMYARYLNSTGHVSDTKSPWMAAKFTIQWAEPWFVRTKWHSLFAGKLDYLLGNGHQILQQPLVVLRFGSFSSGIGWEGEDWSPSTVSAPCQYHKSLLKQGHQVQSSLTIHTGMGWNATLSVKNQLNCIFLWIL